ncbi:RNA polymerase sigma factor SigJ [Paenibacillus arenilitoris]|uniref:RNA polymerase sigma factor SigJ n=1 Tax=Paenibacillus arenilitoris TaxID=2772299 RepID=A0A927CPA8_9BACL|nr:RNA polymerase sigma factor SigJ [Paenibacillus arenilitoris]MBD2871679.1 RNA polymerase sigma factor SigJ [Paenibacillus arenilitoris]
MQQLYDQYRGLLFNLAYQLTGSVSDAEDVVQDVFLKAYDVPPEKLAQPKAYLCKMVANRCKDLYKSARRKREQYVGEWLPEPYLSSEDDGMEAVVRDDLLSYATLVLLERLSPAERTVFVLREALGFDFKEIADLIDKSEVNCRKLLSRARSKMGIASEEAVRPEGDDREWARAFVEALKQGDLNRILSMLDQDVVLVADGGGKVSAAINPIIMPERVANLLLGSLRTASIVEGIPLIELGSINGQPGVMLRSKEGVHTVAMLHAEGDRIRNVYIIRNPDKLHHVG